MDRRLTAQEKVDRDAQVIADRARRLPWTHIAERHGISERQCRNIWKARHEHRPDLLTASERQGLIHESLSVYDAAIEDLAVLADETANDAVKLGAIKARLGAQADKVEFLQAVGLLPDDLYVVSVETDMRRAIDKTVEIFEEFGVPGGSADGHCRRARSGGIAQPRKPERKAGFRRPRVEAGGLCGPGRPTWHGAGYWAGDVAGERGRDQAGL